MKLRCGSTSSNKCRKINASISWDCSEAKAAWSGSKTNPPWAVHLFKPPALPEVADSTDEKVELLNARLSARAPVVSAVDAPLKESQNVAPLAVGKREIYFDGDQPVAAPVYKREDLLAGVQFLGPAIIDQIDTTIPIFPGDRLSVHASGNLIIEVER